MFESKSYDLHEIMKKKDSYYRELAAKYDLSECSFWILYVLRSNIGLLTQRDLCNYLKQPKQSVHTGMKKLLDKSYIEFSAGEDKRSKYITLTKEGENFAEETIDKVIEQERKALTGLSIEDQEKMLSLFQKYTELLEERFTLL